MTVTTVSTLAWLDWNQRPDSLKAAIDKSHIEQSKMTESYAKECKSHGICNLNEFNLLKAMITEAYPVQKEFNVLEIGSRRFEWCQALADFIEKQNDLPKDIKIHIFGIRNENYLGERVVETDRCKIYKLGAFKIEELFASFKKLKFDLENKVDMAISSWELRAEHDPVATVAQTINLLRPNGYFLTNGFFFLNNNENMEESAHNMRLTQLFLDLKLPFLTQHNDLLRSLNHFILKKQGESPCQLPMSYLDTCLVDGDRSRIHSNTVTRFKREPQPGDLEKLREYRKYEGLYGNKATYEWLRKNNVLHNEKDYWHPLQAKDDHLMAPPLHNAFKEGDLEKIEKLLEEGHNIDESSSLGAEGNNPIHIAISMIPHGEKYYKAFEALVKRGPDLNLFNSKGHTALHEAVLIDSPQVIQTLLDAGANIEAKAWGGPTALSCAIQEKKDKAIEILTKNGALISKTNEKDLREAGHYNLKLKIRLTAM